MRHWCRSNYARRCAVSSSHANATSRSDCSEVQKKRKRLKQRLHKMCCVPIRRWPLPRFRFIYVTWWNNRYATLVSCRICISSRSISFHSPRRFPYSRVPCRLALRLRVNRCSSSRIVSPNRHKLGSSSKRMHGVSLFVKNWRQLSRKNKLSYCSNRRHYSINGIAFKHGNKLP